MRRGRVVAETDGVKSASCSSSALEMVVFPAPDGDESTSIRPRLLIEMSSIILFPGAAPFTRRFGLVREIAQYGFSIRAQGG